MAELRVYRRALVWKRGDNLTVRLVEGEKDNEGRAFYVIVDWNDKQPVTGPLSMERAIREFILLLGQFERDGWMAEVSINPRP